MYSSSGHDWSGSYSLKIDGDLHGGSVNGKATMIGKPYGCWQLGL